MSKKSLVIIILILVIAVVSSILTYSYSSIGGSSQGPLANNANENQLQCPDLSQAKLYGHDRQLDVWVASKVDYETKTEKLVYSPDVSYGGSFIEKFSLDPQKVYLCDLGKQGGQNSSNVYCGDFIRPIALYKLDASGNIVNSSKTSVEIMFDSKTNKYISTKCGTYDAINAPF